MIFDEKIELEKLILLRGACGSGKPMREYTATGNPLTFNTNKAKPLKSLSVPWTPSQSGSGDPSPENVRPISGVSALTAWQTGKNLFDYANADIQANKIRDNSGTEIGDVSGSYSKYMIPVVPNTKYTYSGFTVNNRSKRVYFLEKDGTFISRSDAYTDPFTVTTPANCYYCQLQNREVANAGWQGVMFEYGETASAFTPYTGTSYPVSFPALGKNLLNKANVINGNFSNSSTGTVITSNNNARIVWMPCEPNTAYTCHKMQGGNRFSIYTTSDEPAVDVLCTQVTRFDYSGNYMQKITTPSNANYLCLFVWLASVDTEITAQEMIDSVMVELGAVTPSAYEPYTNTCYGGTLELSTGVLTVDWELHDMGEYDWQNASNANSTYAVLSWADGYPGDNFTVPYLFVDSWNGVALDTFNRSVGADGFLASFNQSKRFYIMSLALSGMSSNEIKEYVTGMKFAIKLAEPYTIQLPATTIIALLGDNTIWSDTNGSNTAVYLKKG